MFVGLTLGLGGMDQTAFADHDAAHSAQQCQDAGGTWDDNKCTGASTPSNSEPQFVKNDCNGENIRAGAPEGSEEHCGILDYLVLFINVLAGLVGVVVVISIIVAGIQYSTAGADPQKVSAAKNRIRNALIALFFFLFMYAFLNYLVPGGVL